MQRKTKIQRYVKCPRCGQQTRPWLLERVAAVLHVPERYKVKCSKCGDVFYTVADNGS